MVKLTGRCLCGAVTWAFQGPRGRNLICHCETCQRAASSAYAAFVEVDPDRIEWEGPRTDYQSSPGTFRGFCPTCGTRLYFRSDRWPGELHIHAATLDNPALYQPDCQVVLCERAPWLDGIADLPRYDGFDIPPTDKQDPDTC